MNDYMVENLYPDQDAEPSWFAVSEDQLPPIAWQSFHARLRWATRTEQLWEWGFVIAAFGVIGWYMFWFVTALQHFTIIPWP